METMNSIQGEEPELESNDLNNDHNLQNELLFQMA